MSKHHLLFARPCVLLLTLNDTAHGRSNVPTGIQLLDKMLQSRAINDAVHMIENDVVDVIIEVMITGKVVWKAFELYGEL